MSWSVYIIKCSDRSLYTGISTDVKRRISEHNNKLGSKSLPGKLPVKLVYFEECQNQRIAARREREIKRWKRYKKLDLVNSFSQKIKR